VVVWLLVISAVWWWTGPSKDETTIYYASCTSFTPILPPSHSVDTQDLQKFEKSYERYRRNRAACGILAGGYTTYKLNAARAEVYYDLGTPKRLIDCAILDNKNWRCAYPADKQDYMTVKNGLEGIRENYRSFRFSVYRYQWWYVTIYWLLFSEPPRGEWLIPEQEIGY
jgi:hypothetical protein